MPALRVIAMALVAMIVAMSGPARAAESIKRDVLALYDSRFEAEVNLTRIHKFAEMPLNWLGLSIVYHDIDSGLPEQSDLGRYRGILTWFEEPLSRSAEFVDFAVAASERGVRVVMLGDPGIAPQSDSAAQFEVLFRAIGLRHTGEYGEVPIAADVIDKDPAVIEFEKRLDPVIDGFPLIAPDNPGVVAHLSVSATRSWKGPASVLVATGPKGGYAYGNFTIQYEPLRDRLSWVLNPFRFFELAFAVGREPIPDVTTLMGRRIYFSHIDGDGWNNISEILQYKKTVTRSAEVVLKELIEPYPDLPVTVGLIAGDVDPDLGGDPEAADVARKLFALPQVEVGSHTHTHPYNWKFFELYNREDETALIDQHQKSERRFYNRAIGTLIKLAKKEKPQDVHQRYIAGTDDLPRTYMRRPFVLDTEVEGALRVAENLAPDGKRAMLYQWSGDTTPFEGAVRATREAGVRNINGGDSRFDVDYPSIAYVPAIGRRIGKERQIYAANSNENTYTNDWQGPYYAFSLLTQTLHNTEHPRRLKPMNVYYHMYSGEKPAALKAVKTHLEAAKRGHVIPVPASLYSGIADSFYGVEIVRQAAGRWRISKRGDLQTIRFDNAGEVKIDVAESRGVIGLARSGSTLYVALDPAVENPVIAEEGAGLDQAPQAHDAPDASLPRQPMQLAYAHLFSSRWRFSGLERTDCGIRASVEGFGPGEMEWAGLKPGGYRLVVRRGASILWRTQVEADAAGRMSVSPSSDVRVPAQLELSCVGNS